MKPRIYDMTKKEDVERWFNEMGGYLRTGYGENKTIVDFGTDFEGRTFAMDGFLQLKKILSKNEGLCKQAPCFKLISKKYKGYGLGQVKGSQDFVWRHDYLCEFEGGIKLSLSVDTKEEIENFVGVKIGFVKKNKTIGDISKKAGG